MAANVVAVLGDVGEQREVAERAHHPDCLLGGQRIERARQRRARRRVFLPAVGHRELADLLDALESFFALVGANGVTEQASEEADVLGEPQVLVVAVVHAHSIADGNP